MALQQALRKIWRLTYANKSEKRSNATVVKLEVILKLLTHKHNPRTVFTSRTSQRRTITATHTVDAF